MYHVLLRFFVDLGLVNQPIKLDLKVICTVGTKMSKLSESNRQVLTFPTTVPEEKLVHHAAPYIQYKQIRLNNLYKQ